MVVLGAILLVCPLATCGAGLVVRTRLAAAWDAFLGVERETRSEPRDPADSTEAPQRDEPRPPEIPLHDGREEQIGGVAISVERCSRRRADDGRWLVDMPITLRNVGDDAMTFQRSELSVDGYVATGESSLPVFGMAATGRSFSGHMVWRATGDGAPADTVTVRFRGWARRVPVGDGPRLPPRP